MSFAQLQATIEALNKARQVAISDLQTMLYLNGLDSVYREKGAGSYTTSIADNISQFDRFGIRFTMDNYNKAGYLFMTRPMLNLSSMNLRQDRIMNLLDTFDNRTIPFAIRAYLDTFFCLGNAVRGSVPPPGDNGIISNPNYEKVLACPFIDVRSPWFNILQNNVTGFSGSPTYQLKTFTEEGGFFGESQSISIGSNSYKEPFDLQLEFLDPAGAPIAAIFLYWTRYMQLVNEGLMVPYPFQIDQQIINYTVSFYRFIMDPSMQYIERWFKYTGCFPIARPGASVADFNRGDVFVEAARKFSIGFRCGSGVVDENDPMVLKEFNDLATRYYSPFAAFRDLNGMDLVDNKAKEMGLIRNPLSPEYNYTGLPYINFLEDGRPRLSVFRESNEYAPGITSSYQALQAASTIDSVNKEYDTRITALLEDYYRNISVTSNNGVYTL